MRDTKKKKPSEKCLLRFVVYLGGVRRRLLVYGIDVRPLQIVQIHAEVLLHHPVHSHGALRELGQLPRGIILLDDGGRGQGRRVAGALQPRMFQDPLGADALAGVLHQQG